MIHALRERPIRITSCVHIRAYNYAYAHCAIARVASFPGHFLRGRKKRPGIHCWRMRTIFRKISVKYPVSRRMEYAVRKSQVVYEAHVYWFVYARVLECSRMAVCCRVCLSAVEPKHSTALFTAKGVELRWPERLTELLCVPVSDSDKLPGYICRSCRSKVESLESKLTALRQRTHKSYEMLCGELTASASRKRPKHTSSNLGVSPATAEARPPSKRATLQGKQLFPSENEEHSGECK